MNETLSNTIEMIRDKKRRHLDEYRTTCFINGILYGCGWNIFDPDEVTPQYSSSGKRPDIALGLFDNKNIFVEIKRINRNLNNDVKQLKGYLMNNKNFKYGFLTNACQWQFYASSVDEYNQIQVELIDQVDIDENSKIEKFFFNYLSKEKMVEEYFQTNITILKSNNVHDTTMNAAIFNLRKMKDKRVIETFEEIFKNEEYDNNLRLNALNGLVELSNEKYPTHLIKEGLKSDQTRIKSKCEILLKEIEEKMKRNSLK